MDGGLDDDNDDNDDDDNTRINDSGSREGKADVVDVAAATASKNVIACFQMFCTANPSSMRRASWSLSSGRKSTIRGMR